MRLGEGKPAVGLVGPPHAVGSARALADRRRGDDGCVHGAREIDRPQPLLAREHATISLRRVFGRCIRVGEIGRVGPGTTDSHIGWAERPGHRTQAPVGEIDRWTVLVEIRTHPGGCVAALGFRSSSAGGLRYVLVRLPEAAAGDLQHFYVVGLIALVDQNYKARQQRTVEQPQSVWSQNLNAMFRQSLGR
jgi:hypothetical protein